MDIEGLTPDEKQAFALMRTPKLSIKHLDEERRQMIRQCIQHLHHEKGVSLTDLAKLVGNKTSGYMSWAARQLGIQPRDFEEARLAGIKQKVRKYERKPFDGTDEDKAYILGFRHGDLYVSRPWVGATSVSTSTTHPAEAKLFTELFSPYGHVYQYPRYKKDTQSYEWNLQTILDNSFEFLLDEMSTSWQFMSKKENAFLSYLAGIVDSEGYIDISRNAKNTAIVLNIYNTNTELLNFCRNQLLHLGYSPLELYLDKEIGTRMSKWGIEHKKDYWRVVLARFEQVQSLLNSLPLRHEEKKAWKSLALALRRGDPWKSVEGRVGELRSWRFNQRQRFIEQAETQYKAHHPTTSQPPPPLFFPHLFLEYEPSD